MLPLRYRTTAVATLALVAGILPVVGAASAQAAPTPSNARSDRAPSLFASTTEPAGRRAAERPGVERSRAVTIDTALLPSKAKAGSKQSLRLNLFPDADFGIVVDKVTTDRKTTSWSGTLRDEAGAPVAGGFDAVRVDDTYLLQVDSPEGTFQVSHVAGRTYRVTEIETVTPAKNDVVLPPKRLSKSKSKTPAKIEDESAPAPGGQPDVSAASDTNTIDVLVVYTAAAEAAAGGPAPMLAQIQLGINQTNAAYASSGIPAAVRLVGATPTPTASVGGNLSADLARIRTPGDGYYDEVQATRESVHADLVSLWISGDPQAAGICGLGYLGGYGGNFYPEYGFTAMYLQQCATANGTFAHELGHNLGADHDAGASSPPQSPIPYARGYVDVAGNFRTIMSYFTACSACARVNYYSNPGVLYNGRPTGTASANNASTINQSVGTVANYRQSQIYPADVTLSGTTRVKGTLTANPGTWLPGDVTLGYQWFANGVPVTGATNQKFKLSKYSLGKTFTVTVTGSAPYYAPVQIASAPTPAITKREFKKTKRPKLKGKPRVGRILTVTVKAKKWKPKKAKFKYKWLRNGKKIKGQGKKDRTYRVRRKDKGKKIQVKVIARKKGYAPAKLTTKKVKIKKRRGLLRKPQA